MKNILIISEDNKYNFSVLKNGIGNKHKISHALIRDKTNIDLLKKLNKDIIIEDYSNFDFLHKNICKKNNNKQYLTPTFKNDFFDLLQYYEYEKKFDKKKKNFLLKKTIDVVVSFVEKNNFDIIYFSHIPHNFLDFTFIHICEKKKIKVILTRGFPVPNYYFFSKKIYKVCLLKKPIKKKSTNKFYKDIKKNIINFNTYCAKNTLWQNHELIKIHRKVKFFNMAEIFYIFKRLFLFVTRFFLLSIKFLLIFVFDKKKFISLFYLSEIEKILEKKKIFVKSINILKMEEIHFFNDIKKNNLIKIYLGLTHKVNLNDRYVFFPLWFQPSSTTYPYASRFKNYLNSIKIIAKSIPTDAILYVRESADIFNISRHAWTRGINNRSKKFYYEINKIQNVRLIDFEIRDEILIKKCLFSVSTADKLGVMALYYNKSIINFSDSVFKYFRNCFQYKNQTKLKNDINFILKSKDQKKNFFKNDIKIINNNFFYRPKIIGKDNFNVAKQIDYRSISDNFFRIAKENII